MRASNLKDVSSAFRQHIKQYLVLYHLLLRKILKFVKHLLALLMIS